MLGALGVALVVAAAPVRVAVPGFTAVGIEPGIVDVITDHFVTLLGADGRVRLTTQRDIGQVLGLERQRQLLGCADTSTSCLAELAGALGVDAILAVTLARTESGYTATVRVLKSTDGSQLVAVTDRFKTEGAMQDWLDAQAPTLVTNVVAAFEQRAAPASASLPVARLIPGLGAAVVAVGGGILFGLSRTYESQLRTGYVDSRMSAASLASTGRNLETIGAGMMVAGAVVMGASAVWTFLGPRGDVQVAFLPVAEGGLATVGGSF